MVFARDVTCLSDCVSLESMYSLLYTASAIAMMAMKREESVFMGRAGALYAKRD